MILQALAEYYERKSNVDQSLAPAGFESKEIPFVLEIDVDGRLIQIEDTREMVGKKKRARVELVPQGVKKTSGVAANLLWDSAEYVLGVDTRGKPERVAEQFAAFRQRVDELESPASEDSGIEAIRKFYLSLDLGALDGFSLWQEITETNPNLTFRLQGERALICQRANVITAIKAMGAKGGGESGRCLISGEQDEIERLHTSIKGVWGAQSSGANIVSFNLDAFNSFGKAQGNNAPVGKQVSFAYTTALNHLLGKDSTQRMQVGDASTVFWAEKPSALESGIVDCFGEPKKDAPDSVNAVHELYKSMVNGRYHGSDRDTRFYVLGLAPNAARIAVRFWHVGTVAEMAERIVQHFDDLQIVHGPKEPEYFSLFRLLVSTASLGKADNIPPNLAGDVMRSIIEGLPYPQTLLGAAIRRIKAEQHVNYQRAALIKACINRSTRYTNSQIKEELKVSLDEQNTNIGYRLGRLFAVLEKAQEEANPGINATIRDRYYGSASSSPVTVFSTLMKLSKHHIAKLGKGRAVNLERLIGEILGEVQDFPSHLAIADQGRFAIGYYHQRQSFFKKSEEKEMIHE